MSEESPAESLSPPPAESAPPAAASAPEGVLKGDKGIDVAQVWISAFLILVAGCAAYANVFGVPFHGLDLELFSKTPALQSTLSAPEAFAALPSSPLTVLSYGLNWSLTPGGAREFHLIGLLLHLANGVLLYLLCRRLVRPVLQEPVAMLAGLLFVVHPLTSESLSYVVGRPMLMGTFFALLSAHLFLRATAGEEVGYVRLAVSLGCYAAAVASNASFLLLPVALLGLDFVAAGASGPAARLKLHALYFGLLLVLAVALTVPGISAPFPPAQDSSKLALLSQLSGQLTWKFLAPLHLSPVHDPLLEDALSMAGMVTLLVLLVAAVLSLRQGWAAGAALVWALAMLAGAALFLPAEVVLSERALYPALAGLCLLLPWLFSLLDEALHRKVLGGLAAVAVLVLLWQTFLRVAVWQDPVVFWERVAEDNPDLSDPFRYIARFGEVQIERLQPDAPPEMRAELLATVAQNWQRVLDLEPDSAEAQAGLGKALFAQQSPAEALPHLENALRTRPDDQQLALYLAMAHESAAAQGEGRQEALRKAVQYYAHAQALGAIPPEITGRIGLAHLQLGDLPGSIPPLATAAQALPESPMAQAFGQVGSVVQHLQQLDQQAQELLTKNPQDPQLALIRAQQQLLQGDFLTAFYLFDRAWRRHPQDAEAWTWLGAVRARMGQSENFLKEAGGAFGPDENVWLQLAQRTATTGDWDGALAYLNHYQTIAPGAHPEMMLGNIAFKLQQLSVAQRLFQQAAEKDPTAPYPWLLLADIAIATKNAQETQRLLGEAQRRGAPEEEVKRRAEGMGVTPEIRTGPQRTVIQ